jgi:hypothetical protein
VPKSSSTAENPSQRPALPRVGRVKGVQSLLGDHAALHRAVTLLRRGKSSTNMPHVPRRTLSMNPSTPQNAFLQLDIRFVKPISMAEMAPAPCSPKTAAKPAPVSQTRPTPLPSARPGLPLRPMPHVTARTQTKPTAQPPKPASSEEPAESSSGAAASAATTGLVALAGTAATAAVVASTKEESQPAAPVAEPSRAAEASEATANAEEKEELAAAPSAPETESHAEEPVSAPNKQEAEPKAPDEDEEPSEQPAAPAAGPAGGEEAEAPAAIVEPSAEPEPEAPTEIEAPPAAAEVAAPVEASLSGEKTMGKVEEPIEPPFEQADKAETTAAVAEKTDSSPVVVQEATSSPTPTSITPAVAPAAISQTGASDVDSEEPSETDETNGSASSASGAASTEPVENENSEAVQAPADATLPQLIPDEADADVEGIDDVAIPAMRFDEAPTAEEPLNEMEVKVRDMSIHAHKLIKETAAGTNRLPAALKEQQAALDLCVGEGEGVGKVRPSLVAACAFQLGEMLLAHRKFDECKTAVAIGHSAAKEVEEGKGAVIRALMNYGNVLKSESKTKPRSVRETFQTALTIAREELGIVHATSEQVKMELVAQLLSSGRDEEAMNIMKTSVDDLLAEAERLSKEEAEGKEEQAKAAKAGSDAGEEKEEQSEGDAAVAAKETKPANGGDSAEFTDPGSGLEHIAAEQEGNAAAAGDNNRLALRSSQAKHFAMRNLTTMSTLLDQRGQFDSSHDALAKAVELAIDVHGENSVPHMNVLYAVGQHMRRRGNLEEAIVAHETVLGIMDETIEVYDPELLQHRVSVLRDTAVLYDLKGDPESAVDYAQVGEKGIKIYGLYIYIWQVEVLRIAA